jgi:hypothetical protein
MGGPLCSQTGRNGFDMSVGGLEDGLLEVFYFAPVHAELQKLPVVADCELFLPGLAI